MSRDEDGFLARWSRRKREADALPQESPTPPVEEGAPTAEASPASPEPDPDAITPEELAALPPVESIGAETDIAGFLRKGVPAALRKAALRRVWAADPAIRDYVNEAREYAYDWNVPGGVPGSGELLPTDDVEGMLARIFGGPPQPRPDVTQADAGPPAADDRTGDPAEPAAGAPETASAQGDSAPAQPVETRQKQSENAPDPASIEGREADPPPKKRHGGAIPV